MKVEVDKVNVINPECLPANATDWENLIGCEISMTRHLSTLKTTGQEVVRIEMNYSKKLIEGTVVYVLNLSRVEGDDDTLVIVQTKDKVYHSMNVSKKFGYIQELDTFEDAYKQ